MKITELTAVTLGKKIKAKEITVAEAVSAVLEQIEAVEGDVHAYVTLKDKEKVLKKAEEIQAKIDAGIPIEKVILGGMGQKIGRKSFNRNVSASEEEVKCFERIIGKGVDIFYQLVPDDNAVNIKSIIK